MIIEPRYHESWTRETESTWLTNTDIETPLPTTTGKSHRVGFGSEHTKHAGGCPLPRGAEGGGILTVFMC